MSFWERIFKRREAVTRAKLFIEPTTGFSSYGGDAYANDVYREAVDAIARNAGKLKGSHVISYADHNRVDGDCKLNRLLQTRPNPYMSAYDLLYKMVTHLFLYNNSFAYLDRDDRGNLRGIYPITASSVNVLSDAANSVYLSFTLRNGRPVLLPYGDVIHLRRFFNDDELLGADNQAIFPGLELANTQNEGIINGIKAGASIRGILKFTQILSPGKLKEEKDAFVKDYLEMGNDGGVVATDQKMDYQPIESKPVILNADQEKEIKAKIYNYLGVTEAIVNSSYTEDQYAAFYESTLEPIATALSQEFTAKLFNDREQAYGNSVIFESGRLQFTSNSTKVSLIAQLMPMGLLTVNQALEILNLPSVADGDRRLQALTQMYFLPKDNFEQRVKEEKIPYDKWYEAGLLRLCEGNSINYSDVTAWFLEMVEKYDVTPAWIYYDPYSAAYWVQEMQSHGFNMVKCYQGVKTLSLPMQQLGQDLAAKKVNYNANPLLLWCITNTGVKTDVNGNIQPVKATNPKYRIDGLASLLDAYVGLLDHYNEYLEAI